MLLEGEYELTSLVPEACTDSDVGAAADMRKLRNTRGLYNWNQLRALLWKHLLFKIRSPAQTLGEIFSPVLLICVLVYAFSYTYVHHFDAEIYANQTEFASLNYEERTLLDCTALMAEEDGTNQTAEDLATLLGDNIDWGTILQDPTDPLLWSRVISALPGKVDGVGGKNGLPSLQELQAERRTYEELQSLLRCMQRNTTGGLQSLLGDIQYHNGPLPVVPFDGYVSTSLLFTQTLKQNRRMYQRVKHATHHGWNIFGNLLDLGRLAFAAETPEGVPGVQRIAHFMSARWAQFDRMFRKHIFESEEEALDYAMGAGAGKLWAVVVFRNVPLYGNGSVESVHAALDYSIRMNFSVVPKTWMVVDILHNYLRTDYKMYYTSGFLSIQSAVDEYAMLQGSILSAREQRSADSRAVAKQAASRGQRAPNDEDVSEALGSASEWGVPMPLAEYNLNPFYKAVGPVLGLVMCLSTLYPLCMLIRGLVEERETKQREVMMIMGLREPLLVASWSITYGVLFGLSAFLVTTVVHYSFFPMSSYSLLLVFFLSFMLSEIPFAFLVASFFSRAKLAAIVGPFLQFMAVMPRYIFFKATDGQAGSGKLMASVLSPTAFTFGADTVGRMEGSSRGMFWTNLGTGDPGFGNIILFMLLDGVLYALLAWLVHYVSSKQDSLKDTAMRMTPRALRSRVFALQDCEDGEDPAAFASDVEQPNLGDEHLEPHIRIQGLRKAYKGVEAVKGLDLDIYADQMTALLGHNGAGKTTTISMLTGMVPPTAGDCVVMGRSIRWEKHLARRNVGICPQHNVLFERITVREHLLIYAALKGVPANEMEAQVATWIDEIGLSDKALAYASSLSGGMKRKLQVGLAMIGDSKVVLLDEPTSGMDPVSRRSLWQLLQRCKQGRAVVLTTHYMDEADLLCDSIVILNRGQVRCRGSSLFLKSRFGVGYTLSLTLSRCGAEVGKAVEEVVRKHVAEAEYIRAVAAELTFRLPLDATPLFPDLFHELEEEGTALGVASFGVSMTTLEDVFLHLGDEAAAAEVKEPLRLEAVELSEMAADSRGEHPASILAEEEASEQERAALVEVELAVDAAEGGGRLARQPCGFFQSVELMLLKRALVASRDMKAMAHFVVLPVIVVSLVLMILHMDFSPAGPALTLNAYLYTAGSRVQYVAFEGWHRYSGDRYSTTEVLLGNCEQHMSQMLQLSAMDLREVPGWTNSTEVSVQLLNDHLSGEEPRYGALVYNDTLGASSAYDKPHVPVTTVLHNASGYHALPAFLSEVRRAKMCHQHKLDQECANSNLLVTRTHPIPLTTHQSMQLDAFLGVLAALFILIPFCYLAATSAIFTVNERVAKSKHLQLVSGCTVLAYWSGTYIWDMLNYMVTVLMTMLVFCLFHEREFVGSLDNSLASFLLFTLYGAAVIPLSYCYSFAFNSASSAQVSIAGVHFVSGFILVITSFVMGGIEDTAAWNEMLVHYYRLLPPFCLGESLIQLSAQQLKALVGVPVESSFSWDVLGRNLTYMGFEAVAFFILTLVLEHVLHGTLLEQVASAAVSLLGSMRSPFGDYMTLERDSNGEGVEDMDVAAERRQVEQLDPLSTSQAVTIRRLRKVYGAAGSTSAQKVAVHNLSYTIGKHEHFGLLGHNGAGKTTTLAMLTGDTVPTSGDALVCQYSVRKQLREVQRNIGYCPQVDPLLGLLTGDEQLAMFARLKGVPAAQVQRQVKATLKRVGLPYEMSHRCCHTYSGGNKRKIALAMALVGSPAAIFLDEPSSGMDPQARRAMWDTIQATTAGLAIILTTHSMEECEALCTRVGIMANGRLSCIGSPQHLRQRFGTGYRLEVRLSKREEQAALSELVRSTFAGAQSQEDHMGRMVFSLPLTDLSLSKAFRVLEDARSQHAFEDYSLSQPTLEQVFVSIADKEHDNKQGVQ